MYEPGVPVLSALSLDKVGGLMISDILLTFGMFGE